MTTGNTRPFNRYNCQTCGGFVITEDVDQGVTPFEIMCLATKNCEGGMFSSFYSGAVNTPATLEWYKPGFGEILQMPEEHREHYIQGGLRLRWKHNKKPVEK